MLIYDVLTGALPYDNDFAIDSICGKAGIEPSEYFKLKIDPLRSTENVNFFLDDTAQNRIILAGFVTPDNRIVIEAWGLH